MTTIALVRLWFFERDLVDERLSSTKSVEDREREGHGQRERGKPKKKKKLLEKKLTSSIMLFYNATPFDLAPTLTILSSYLF